nr:MAG TPA: hypothetical protein [Caudoviricetes sp.]
MHCYISVYPFIIASTPATTRKPFSLNVLPVVFIVM